MIYRPDPSQPPLMWQEAPDAIVADPHTGTSHGGAQTRRRPRCDRGHHESVPRRPVLRQAELGASRRPSTTTILNVINSYEERPFGTVLQMALNYAIGHLYNQATDQSSIFCAELVAHHVPGARTARHVTPAELVLAEQFRIPTPSTPFPGSRACRSRAPIELSVPNDGGADVAVAIDVEMTTWPAGPLAPDQLPMPPVLSQAVGEVIRRRPAAPSPYPHVDATNAIAVTASRVVSEGSYT